MSTTRFKMPLAAKVAPGIDHWVTGETEPPVAASRQADTGMGGRTSGLNEMFVLMRFPFMPDVAGLFAAQERNVEAVMAAANITLEGVRSVGRRNIESMRQNMAVLSEHMWTMASPRPPMEKAVSQGELVLKACQQATANMKELGEMIQHTSDEAVEVLNKRFAEVVEEAKSLTTCTARFPDTGLRSTAPRRHADWSVS
jgi:phasin family protein